MEQYLILCGIIIKLLLLPRLSSAQQVPPVACPEYFEYLAYNQEYVGRISIRHDAQYQENTLRVEFSQPGRLNSVRKNFLLFTFGISSAQIAYILICSMLLSHADPKR